MTLKDKKPHNDKIPEKQGGDPIDRLIENLENEVTSIESNEMTHGFTKEELEDKGLIGDKNVGGRPSEKRITTGITFEETVEFTEKSGVTDPADIDPEEIDFLKDVEPGQVVASITLPKNASVSEIAAILSHYDEGYRKKANIELKRSGDLVQFISALKGKAVVLDSFLFIVSGDRDGRCDVRVSPDKMNAVADFFPPLGMGKRLNKNDVLSLLKKQGVKAGIHESKIDESLEHSHNDKRPLVDIIVAEGKKPINGQVAEPQFFFSTDPAEEDFKILPDGRIDYHKKANIPIVKKGSVLAKTFPPQKGDDGFDVSGAVLKAADGALRQLVAGENVAASEDGDEFIAQAEGQVSLVGDIISVFNHYQVNGDVDFGVGNIDFNGNVTIKGMVLPGFEVKAAGDITILKGIECACVNAGGDLKVLGGIIGGAGERTVSCGRNLYANHLQNAIIEAQGDVYVSNSCVQSMVYCNGKVVLRNGKGAVVGGLINALGGVEAVSVGTEFGTKTEIVVGIDFLIQKTAGEIKKALDFHTSNVQKIDKMLTPLLDLFKKGMLIGDEKKNKLHLIVDKRKQIKKIIAILESKLEKMEKQSMANAKAAVKVKGVIYPDVFIRIKNCSKQIIDPLEHVTIFYNKKTEDIDTGPY